ncbi:hypothetical protein QCE62_34770 [Caballeronia sp. LZ033]|uniref:hypothetical protein n=1 Tax=Caballeronia sp. LZ033 TaxID=3038566 RepID=UPI002859B065|nr:hypothetical protein [Caballeronia sp. LZ033]MDR5818792.1 hypothetical protein [Caballeronia sp. LZ033]
MNYIDYPHLTVWIGCGASILPAGDSNAFDDYLSSLEWGSDGGLSEKYKFLENNLSDFESDGLFDSIAAVKWLDGSKVGRDSHIVFWYVRGQPGLICDKEFAIKNVDVAYWKAPGKRFMFGATFVEGKFKLSFDDFLIYSGADKISALA